MEVRGYVWEPYNPEFKTKCGQKDSVHKIAVILETDMGEVEKKIHQYNTKLNKVSKSVT
jgi:hypothetical protein